ncbi:MAG: DEAD/DEAH box helicase family protein [Bacilli bacterium]|nr:DEAD/DEAH box helicase family protein [Bacilli bacterium]MDD2681479.1 DEAD/DEAH box helicase family protein [Bacilli bacterium]MDD3121276.1 DEAD/DEAH box helicase family protein [Bacilli bacterium]MDD4062918.1 DEAD/DEAH box helicase family protein [Bacilli bacterium]MDD4482276.1 DEAD/DEAH box helicase family protein [Bacilli bacterium]
MKAKEAKARIKINKLLEESGWRFFDTDEGPANIYLEPNVKITQKDIDSFGEDFEKTKNGFIDYLLLDDKSNPLIVLEAKREGINPLIAKEQARKYANSLRAKYIILSNGETHYFWNLSKGNPEIITAFPTYESLIESKALNSTTNVLVNMNVDKYFIALSQDPSLENNIVWKLRDEDEIDKYCKEKEIRILRYYQLNAIKSVQEAVSNKKNRFLFEMATGTGKTLTAAGVIKLFIRSEVANRVLFLVDRLELENQAKKDLTKYLSKDGIKIAVYKENKDDWIKADVVISTIQSFSIDNKYKKLFKPSDFDLVISDEAHRVLGASNRAIFEYFIGYKLGLTATPKNYLKGVDFDDDDPREIEKRLLMDTYHIFGCDSGTPTFSYTLNDGVKDGILVNPIVVDARSEITTQLLSDNGLTISSDDENFEMTFKSDEGETKKVFTSKDFEKEFFSESTNELFCSTFLKNAERDPITNEIGKSIFFCVSIEHACKITQILNILADRMFPGKYNSDFAIQITSNIPDSQQMTINFANNNLSGHTNFIDDYDSSKTRVAVTVGMMTTGYDCRDLLNVCFCRPIFSPSDFIQMKGRGTRIFDFKYENTKFSKEHFKLFDFFGVCEYFENDFNYDEKIKLVLKHGSGNGNDGGFKPEIEKVIHLSTDTIASINEEIIGVSGMKIDRKFYSSFSEKVSVDPNIQIYIRNQDEDGLIGYLQREIFNKPIEFFTLEKIERALGLKRHLTIREVAHNIITGHEEYKTKEEILNDEFENFILINKDDIELHPETIPALREIFVAYLVDAGIREAIKHKQYNILINSPLKESVRQIKSEKIKNMPVLDYIPYYVTTNAINCERFYA